MNNKFARCGKTVYGWWSKSLENPAEKLPQSMHNVILKLTKTPLIPALPGLSTNNHIFRPTNFAQAAVRSITGKNGNVIHTFHKAYYYDNYIY